MNMIEYYAAHIIEGDIQSFGRRTYPSDYLRKKEMQERAEWAFDLAEVMAAEYDKRWEEKREN